MGDLLRIDLTTRTSSEETIPEQLTRELIGAKGIGTHYLCEEIGPEVDPLSPENKLIFVVGPMGGTQMLGSNRYAVYFASPLTGGYGECYSGGNLTPQFARTGYRVVIVEGKADAPVYLEVSEEGVAFHDASDLWGMDAFKAEDEILARTPHKKAQACVIGPAGEKLVRFACVNNNYWHQLGRGGPGAVYGSKNLKGIVWHGEKKVEVARPDDFKAVVRDLIERTKDDPGRRRLPARRHAEHGAHHERRQRVPHALLAQGHAGELRAHHRRDHARRARHRPPHLPALRLQVRQAQHRLQGAPRRTRRRGSRVRDRLRVRRPLRDRRLRRDHVAQRHLRPPRRGHHGRRQPVRAGHRVQPARSHRRQARRGTTRTASPPSSRSSACAKASATSGPRASSPSPRSTASRTWPCTPRAWPRPATSRAR